VLEQKVDERTRLLSRAKREWEVAFDAITDPLMIIDEQYRIVRANLALAAHLGKPIKGLPGLTCHEARATSDNRLPREDDGTCKGCPVKRARAEHEMAEEELVTDTERTYSVGAYPIRGDDDGAAVTVCRYRDLTEQRAMSRKLAQADKLSAMGLLAGGVAHEINNPLGAILAFSQLVQREAIEGDEQKEYLKEIEESALRCKRIVERLLSFARQAKRDERRPFSVNDVVAETAFLVEKSYLSNKVKLERDLDDGVAEVAGNPNEIAQVLLNLVTNARDSMPGGGIVRIATRNGEDGTVILSVSDTGTGIPAHVLERIFDPFFTTKAEGKGTGLGLSVSYGIVRDHKGRIEVRSRIGEGTEFQVVLPRV
jgi:two-component system, NtrC family, sensor kinase